jgi:hypothetical protein
MADLSKATPRPWVVHEGTQEASTTIIGSNQHRLASVWQKWRGHRDDWFVEEGLANAALIVKAVNERDELIALLRRVDAVLQGALPFGTGADYLNDFGHEEMDALAPIVRAALAKADTP